MPAYIIVDLTPTDTEKLTAYSAAAAETLIPFGGEFLVKGAPEILHGEAAHKVKVIIQFPDKTQAQAWYNSDAYQAILPIRDAGMNSQFHLVG